MSMRQILLPQASFEGAIGIKSSRHPISRVHQAPDHDQFTPGFAKPQQALEDIPREVGR
jgi:hypothetical protein